jgi:phosphatidylserine/phosphatidylglycerophosphate/cardiolipin synthase-like enzyme/nucleotide-binding universal stress UspA family protein
MNYRRALLILELGTNAAPHLALLRRVAPRLEHLVVVGELPARAFAWLFGEGPPDEGSKASLQDLREAASGAAPSLEVQVAPELGSDALAALCASEAIDLLVFGSRSVRSAWAVSAERSRRHAVLWSGAAPASGPIREIACVAMDEPSRAEIQAFLRDHADPSMHVTLLSPVAFAPDVVATALQTSGIEARVDVSTPRDAPSLQRWLDDWTRGRPLDLLVSARIPTALVLSAFRAAPVLLIPPFPVVRPPQHALDVPDVVDDGGPLRVRVDHLTAAGTVAAAPEEALAFVTKGRVVATVQTRAGEGELPAGLLADSLGVYRVGEGVRPEPLAAIEQRIAVIRPGEHPLALVDSELPDGALQALAAITGPTSAEVLAVRLRPTRSCHSIRERLRAAGLPARVLDARLVLDEGEALDVSEMLDPMRLARVASRLQGARFSVTVIVHRGQVEPSVDAVAVMTAADLEAHPGAMPPSPPGKVVTPACCAGNRIELELDNATARGWLLDTIARSTRTLHFQVYMALDDDVGGPVEAALAAAAARGVKVRVMVDSLHGLHGSFGARNPLFERLSGRGGVELRALRPITELPSLADLKQRDHRKVVIADGEAALLVGRNLSHEYYTGFEEVRITPASQWRQVPWLDAGARIEGPAVEALERSFLATWVEAGGSPFDIVAPRPAGTSTARIVVHRGLRDAHTLETYRELIETAKSHVLTVNGFPLVLELQHALLSALRRGVRVRSLLGCVTPMHAGQPFEGPWATARTAATQLVHSRIDPIVAAGGEAYLFARRDVPGWAPELGVVHPHVHAKAMSVDGLRCTVGSANLDITASYWESEVLLLVEDAAVVRVFEARIDTLMAGSTRVDRSDPAWRRAADRRAWMRYWPGVLSV